MQIFNQYSYVTATITIGLIALFAISRIPQLTLPIRIVIMVVYVGVVFLFGMSQRYPDSPLEAETVDDVENALINEKPTFLMLYSNY